MKKRREKKFNKNNIQKHIAKPAQQKKKGNSHNNIDG